MANKKRGQKPPAKKSKMPTAAQLKALQMRFVLESLPDRFRSDLLTESTLTSLPGFRITQTITFGAQSVPRDALYTTVRNALDTEKPQELALGRSEAKAQVFVEEDGAAIVEVDKTRFRFENADLLANDVTRRVAAMDRALSQFSVATSEYERLTKLASAGPLAFESYSDALVALEHTAEGFARRVNGALRAGNLAKSDLIVADQGYWTSLVPPPGASAALIEYRDGLLFPEWQSRVAQNAVQGFRAMALTFAGPSLLPQAVFASCSTETKLAMVREAEKFADPYGIVGAVQLCFSNKDADPGFVETGERLLARLADHVTEMRTALLIFCAVYVVAYAEMASSAKLQTYPSWWRRLAVAAHASLFVDSCGIVGEQQEGFIDWAWNLAGPRFALAVSSEVHDQPRWRHDWISPEILFADLVGRLKFMEPDKPQSWIAHIEKLYAIVAEEGLELPARFPAILEGDLPVAIRPEVEFPGFEDAFQRAKDEPSPSNLTSFQPVVDGWAMPETLPDIALGTIERMIADGDSLSDDKVAAALNFSSRIASIVGRADLADRTAQAVISASVRLSEPSLALEAVLRLVMCSEAEPTPTAHEALVSRLEQLVSLQTDKRVLRNLVVLIGSLGALRPQMRPRLARAVAMAELGAM